MTMDTTPAVKQLLERAETIARQDTLASHIGVSHILIAIAETPKSSGSYHATQVLNSFGLSGALLRKKFFIDS